MILKMFVFISLLTPFAFGQQTDVPGEPCDPIDLRETLPPVHDQGHMASCFAFTTADMISQKLGMEVAAIDVASTFIFGDAEKLKSSTNPDIMSYLATHPDFFDDVNTDQTILEKEYRGNKILEVLMDLGGDEGEALMLANTKGLCLEKHLNSTLENQTKLVKDTEAQFSPIEKQPQVISNLALSYDHRYAVESKLEAAMVHLYDDRVDNQCQRLPLAVPLIPREFRIANDLTDMQSRLNTGILDPATTRAQMIHQMNKALQLGRAPAIGYSGRFTLMDLQSAVPLAGTEHSSLIVGRKQINGSCHYLLRNSWGTSCDGYKPSLNGRCEAGNIWLNEEELLKTLYTIIYID